MTRTIRAYNLPGYLFWHPYRQHPNWHVRQDPTGRRQAWKAEERQVIQGEFSPMPEYQDKDELAWQVVFYDHYLDWLQDFWLYDDDFYWDD